MDSTGQWCKEREKASVYSTKVALHNQEWCRDLRRNPIKMALDRSANALNVIIGIGIRLSRGTWKTIQICTQIVVMFLFLIPRKTSKLHTTIITKAKDSNGVYFA